MYGRKAFSKGRVRLIYFSFESPPRIKGLARYPFAVFSFLLIISISLEKRQTWFTKARSLQCFYYYPLRDNFLYVCHATCIHSLSGKIRSKLIIFSIDRSLLFSSLFVINLIQKILISM